MKEYYFNEEHILFRKSLQDFLSKEVNPHVDQWEQDGRVPKSVFKKLGDMGFFGLGMEEKFGGMDTRIKDIHN